ncbi:hypothetical protein P175DRAFT_0436219, partial [Aspergillus ochraceoroseus IBT 24754]
LTRDDMPLMMSEFILTNNSTVMLDNRDMKSYRIPFYITRFFLEETDMPEFKDGRISCINYQKHP